MSSVPRQEKLRGDNVTGLAISAIVQQSEPDRMDREFALAGDAFQISFSGDYSGRYSRQNQDNP